MWDFMLEEVPDSEVAMRKPVFSLKDLGSWYLEQPGNVVPKSNYFP